MHKILVIDDDKELCSLLVDYLNPEGFEIEAVNDGKAGLEQALSEKFDLIVLDVMLPGMNGFDVLNRIRSKSNTPVLMLTAKGDDIDRIVGLEMGADDYLPKPFNPRELVARIRAVLRRLNPARQKADISQETDLLTIDDIHINLGTRTAKQAGKTVSLTAMEFNLLASLMRSAGQIVLREELINEVLGRDQTPFDRSIDVHISNLRKKIGHKSGPHDRIKTIRGVGYQYTQLRTDQD